MCVRARKGSTDGIQSTPFYRDADSREPVSSLLASRNEATIAMAGAVRIGARRAARRSLSLPPTDLPVIRRALTREPKRKGHPEVDAERIRIRFVHCAKLCQFGGPDAARLQRRRPGRQGAAEPSEVSRRQPVQLRRAGPLAKNRGRVHQGVPSCCEGEFCLPP